ncbi:sulfite exporter TauE/SafE family protein [bacterium]|nr:sulfite exporter TauE/SafE family protein [bacterium]
MAVLLAFWLGLLTSISPCPLATNIAAVSYLSKNLKSKNTVFQSFFYTFGRMSAYFLVGGAVAFSISSIPIISDFLQTEIPKFIGPILVIVGMFLLEMITFSIPGFKGGFNPKKGGFFTSWLLGFLFALSFCPVSAALFFGSLIPAITESNSFIAWGLPLFYGIGSAVPVIGFSILLSFGSEYVGKWFNKITNLELWIRKIFGIILILIGLYFSLKYIFEII